MINNVKKVKASPEKRRLGKSGGVLNLCFEPGNFPDPLEVDRRTFIPYRRVKSIELFKDSYSGKWGFRIACTRYEDYQSPPFNSEREAMEWLEHKYTVR